MSLNLYLAYVVTCIVLVVVPGPTVTVIIANSLRYGARAGLLNVAGTQLGLGVMLAIVILGLGTILETLGWWFDVLRWVGAALSDLAWHPSLSFDRLARKSERGTAAARRIFLSGLRRLDEQSESDRAVRRAVSAIHRPERQLHRTGASARPDRDGGRGVFRFALRDFHGPRRTMAVAAPRAAGFKASAAPR